MKQNKTILLFILFLFITISSLKGQIIIEERKVSDWLHGKENQAKISIISNVSTFNIQENNGEIVKAPIQREDGKFVYICICDVTDTNTFGFRISLQGRVESTELKVYIEEKQHVEYRVTVENTAITLKAEITNTNQVLPKENTAAVTILCTNNNLNITSLTGEPAEGPVKNQNGVFEYTLYFDVKEEKSRRIKRALEFSIQNSQPLLYDIGTLSPKQAIEMTVLVIGSEYITHKTNADQLFMNGNYAEAIAAYMDAQNSPDKPEEVNLMEQISKVNRHMMALNKANTFYMAEQWADAKAIYTEILEENPGNQFVAQKIKDCDLKLEPPKAFPPTVETGRIAEIKTHSFYADAHIINTGGLPVSSYGFCWSQKVKEPTIEDNKQVVDGNGSEYGETINNLLPNRTYYTRAFAQNSAGVAYGKVVTVKTVQGQPWIKITPATGLRIPTNPSFAFSNGEHIYFCGDHYDYIQRKHYSDSQFLRYNIHTKQWKLVNQLTNSYDASRVNLPSAIVEDIAYLPSAIAPLSGPTFYGIVRYNMEKEVLLPTIMTNLLTWNSGSVEIVAAFPIEHYCYFLTNSGKTVCFNTQTATMEAHKAPLPVALFKDECTTFTLNGKGYIVIRNGGVYEYNPEQNRWNKRGNPPVVFHKELNGFVVGKKGYVISGDHTGTHFYEYDPSDNTWKKRDVPANVQFIRPFARSVNENYAIIGNGSDSLFLYDPMQENE